MKSLDRNIYYYLKKIITLYSILYDHIYLNNKRSFFFTTIINIILLNVMMHYC